VSYSFRFAETPADYDAVRRLNHRIFAAELGQHETRADGLLVDRFESKSRFLVALHEDAIVGMVAIHDQPPFSIEKRLPSPEALDTFPAPLLEVRLLAIEPDHRNRMVIAGLFGHVIEYALESGYGTILISGIVERLEMYRRMGFVPLGAPVRDHQAEYVPMAFRLSDMSASISRDINRWRRREKAPPA
jgi:predicted N-acetyltransferase YhbS